MRFGTNLERVRKDNGMSQLTLAQMLGLTQQVISGYKRENVIQILRYYVRLQIFFMCLLTLFWDMSCRSRIKMDWRSV